MARRNFCGHELPPELAATLRADAIKKSARPEDFWIRQRSRIRARIGDAQPARPHGFRLAMAAALVFCIALLLVAPAGRPREVAPQARADADQELLLAVEHALATGTPEALEPLTLLVESSSNLHDAEATSHKEHRNED